MVMMRDLFTKYEKKLQFITIISFVSLIFVYVFFQNMYFRRAVSLKVSEIASIFRFQEFCFVLPEKVQEGVYDPDADGKGVGPSYSYERDKCLLNYSQSFREKTSCDWMVAEGAKDNCLLLLVQKIGNPEMCAAINYRFDCYAYMAELYSEPKYCAVLGGASPGGDKVICRAVASKNYEVCFEYDHLSYSNKTDCIKSVVDRTKDENACLHITEPVIWLPWVKMKLFIKMNA